ncbi:O-methyltransferase mpaG [Colletotrichum sp. SAR 10_65]|nr:O-methyltransferase mpaG [Colletotrichum sp. SAR 10_65]KAI8212899.1 O-methyltransferase mpaG [Colletotrichum sp. SAR 10_76]KAI8258128.1 O-methyltransferase mpaG [Colletotrichum sp. SAR 10_77]
MGSLPERLPLDPSVAIQPNDAKRVAELSNAIGSLGATWSPSDDATRNQLLKQARALVLSLETPRETMIRHVWAQPNVNVNILAGIYSGLWKHMTENPGPKKVEKLAYTLGFDADVLARLLRHLGAMGYIKEVGADEYELTNFSKSLSLPLIAGGYPVTVGGCWPTLANFPTYLKKNNWRIHEDPKKGPMQDIIGEDSDFFNHMMTNYPAGEFQNHMAGYRQGRPSWMDADFFPVAERLIQGADTAKDAAFLVDIGGSTGHDIDEFCRKHPNAPGRHVLQDLPHVLAQVEKIDPKIEPMEYDFHTEQPVKGARAYYLHSVLHDWTDEVGKSILARVTAAMKPGYSKLLINENVVPGTGANWQTTALDMMMLTLFASRERTEAQWRSLLEPAGLKIVKIWSKGEGVESLIECELA